MQLSLRQFFSSCLGNLFEHYDTALFGFLSPFLAPLIFPDQDPIVALILTYAIMPIGMIARPIGSLVFGYIGDLYGRRHALFITLAGMAFISGCIAFIPTYAQIGIFAPILFCVARMLQNFLAAGEIMGGAILLLENAPVKKYDLLSSLFSASAIGGHLLASLAVFLFSYFEVIDQGWRVLYLFGCITALFGLMIRGSTPLPKPTVSTSQAISSMKETLWKHRKILLFIAINTGFANATYSIALILMNGFIPLVTSFTKTEVMQINTYLLLFDLSIFPLFGWVASKISREKLMLSVALCVLLFAMPLLVSLQGASFATIVLIRMVFVVFGVAFFAPFHAWAQMLVPPSCRYAVISLGYALGTQLLGSPTAALALWSYQKTGMVSSIAWYWMALATASTVSILIALRSRDASPEKA